MDRKKMNKDIIELNMDGLSGRMLAMKSSKAKEILLVYGHHSSIERMYAFAELLRDYGNVTMPDLPGFGGMDSFYSRQEKPSIDQYADYLAAFVKMRYKRKRVVIIGFSFSVPIIVRMLQKYPELVKKVEFVVSVVGFVHFEDFKIPKTNLVGLKLLSQVGSMSGVSWFLERFIFRPALIRAAYYLVSARHQKLKDGNKSEIKMRIDFEAELWTINDLRTWFYTIGEMIRVNLCDIPIKLPVHHVVPDNDVYFDANVVEQHLKIIFSTVKIYKTTMPNHAPSIIADRSEIEPYFPPALRKVLLKS